MFSNRPYFRIFSTQSHSTHIISPAQSPRSPFPLRRTRRTILGGRSFSSDINSARSAYLHVARIASLPRRRSRMPLPLFLLCAPAQISNRQFPNNLARLENPLNPMNQKADHEF
jgi:hypothetical protein